jgi:hypothetical protein
MMQSTSERDAAITRMISFGTTLLKLTTILWVAFLDPSDSYFLFAELVGFYTH